MTKGLKISLVAVVILVLVTFVAINIFCRNEARNFAHFTLEEQQARWEKEVGPGAVPNEHGISFRLPEDSGLPYEEVTLTNSEGMKLNGWYMPSSNRAAVMLMHGVHEFPYHMLEEAELLQRHGYGALLISIRDHNFGDGDTISFGCGDRELSDLDAWYKFLVHQDDVDADRIGVLGQSLGGSLVIQYSQQNSNIKATIAHSPFSSVDDTVATVAAFQTGLPLWATRVLSADIMFWLEKEIDCNLSELSAKGLIGGISPRPVYIFDAENDEVVAPESGEMLMEAARDPKKYWLCKGSFHHECDTDYPEEFERRMIDFFDQYLLKV